MHRGSGRGKLKPFTVVVSNVGAADNSLSLRERAGVRESYGKCPVTLTLFRGKRGLLLPHEMGMEMGLRCTVVVLVLVVAFPAFAQPKKPDVQEQVAALIKSMEESDYAGRDAVKKLVAIGIPAVEKLIEAFKHKTPRVRYWSASAVATIGDERAYKPLVDLVRNDKHGLVRCTALWHLQHYPRKESWDLAIEMLDDPSTGVRGWAMKLLAAKKRREAVPKLKVMTKHRNHKTRYDAMVSRGKIVDVKAVDTLRDILRSDDNVDVRKGALTCITIIAKKTAPLLLLLIDGLEDRDESVRELAARLLRRGTNQEFPFTPAGDPEERAAAVIAWREWFDKHKDRLYWDDKLRRFEIRKEKKKPEGKEKRED